jgi:DNA-binding Xre family transcriptional regulator
MTTIKKSNPDSKSIQEFASLCEIKNVEVKDLLSEIEMTEQVLVSEIQNQSLKLKAIKKICAMLEISLEHRIFNPNIWDLIKEKKYFLEPIIDGNRKTRNHERISYEKMILLCDSVENYLSKIQKGNKNLPFDIVVWAKNGSSFIIKDKIKNYTGENINGEKTTSPVSINMAKEIVLDEKTDNPTLQKDTSDNKEQNIFYKAVALGAPFGFKPNRNFYVTTKIGQKRFGILIRGEQSPFIIELKSICKYFEIDFDSFIKEHESSE